MKKSFAALLICCCVIGLSGRANALCDYLPSVITDSDGTWTIDEYCFSSDPEARTYCSSLSNYRMEGPLVDRGVSYYYVYLNPVGSYHLAYCWFGDDVDADSDGDGIPDSQDPCPQNPNPDCTDPNDGDGDGIPDDQDPCPQNPNPDCTDPDNPPPDPPDIPGEIVIGDCVIDVSELTEFFSPSSGTFPFNWIWAFMQAARSIYSFRPTEFPSAYSFTFAGKEYSVELHLERFDTIASFFRFFVGLTVTFYILRFVNKGIFKIFIGSGA